MSKGQIPAFAGFDGESEADQPCTHRIEARGFGVDGDQGRLRQRGKQAFEALFLEDQTVLSALSRGLRLRLARERIELAQPARELEALEKLAQGLAFGRLAHEIAGGDAEGKIVLEGDELLRARQPFGGLAKVLAEFSWDVLCVRDEVFEGAVGLEPFRGGLLAAFFDALDVVDLVADEGEEIGYLARLDSEFGLHPGLVELGAAHRVHQPDTGADELREILVAGRDHDLDALGGRPAGEGGDHIIGFDIRDPQHRHAELLDDLDQRFDLAGEIIGHRRPVGLVLGVALMPEIATAGIEDEGDVIRVFRSAARTMLRVPNIAWVGSPARLLSGGRAW